MALGASRSARMSSGLLLDPLPSPTTDPANPNGTRYRPYASPDHHVTKARYITSNDPRGYIPVYEYPLNGQWIMLDMDDGYVLWTGIWKALGNSKADIVKIIDSQPEIASQLRRVRGGYLKIQGTWMPYEIALRLARRVAWPIRYDLVPLFGPTFPETCLPPDSPGYGQISKPGSGKRRSRRNVVPTASPSDSRHDWTVSSPSDSAPPSMGPPSVRGPMSMSHTFASRPGERHYDSSDSRGDQNDSPVILHVPYVQRPHASSVPSTSQGYVERNSPSSEHTANVRYSPYPSPLSATAPRHIHPIRHGPGSADTSPTISRPPNERVAVHSVGGTIKLPPIHPPAGQTTTDSDSFHLPPISSMDNIRNAHCDEPMAVLRRLQSNEEPPPHRFKADTSTQRRHSAADPVYRLSDLPATSTSVGVGANMDVMPRTPLSTVAASPPSFSYPPLPRHSPSQHQHLPLRSPVEHPEATFPSGARVVPCDDRLTHSMPSSPYLNNRSRHEERYRLQPQERGLSCHDHPLSPPPSASSASTSPSDTVRTSWRPW